MYHIAYTASHQLTTSAINIALLPSLVLFGGGGGGGTQKAHADMHPFMSIVWYHKQTWTRHVAMSIDTSTSEGGQWRQSTLHLTQNVVLCNKQSHVKQQLYSIAIAFLGLHAACMSSYPDSILSSSTLAAPLCKHIASCHTVTCVCVLHIQVCTHQHKLITRR